uniref:RNase H type-1 domain-containing protein n=1 Tax=Chenopodium quinoa TaxID=63459 RepID=A0A803LE86_CHEQI
MQWGWSLYNQSLAWEVENGKDINIWEDKWLGDKPLRNHLIGPIHSSQHKRSLDSIQRRSQSLEEDLSFMMEDNLSSRRLVVLVFAEIIQGIWISGMAKKIFGYSATEGELQAIKMALEAIESNQWDLCIISTDCTLAVELIKEEAFQENNRLTALLKTCMQAAPRSAVRYKPSI